VAISRPYSIHAKGRVLKAMHEAEAWKARRYGRKTQRRGREGWKMRTYWRRDEKLQVFPTTQQSDQTEDSAAEDPLAPVSQYV